MGRFVATLSLALALAAQLAALVHMGVVRHERCPEHGELVERAGSPRLADLDDVLALAALDDSEHDEHDHCPLATTPSLPSAPPALETAGALASPLAIGAIAPGGARAVDVLARAPKTSPPAHA